MEQVRTPSSSPVASAQGTSAKNGNASSAASAGHPQGDFLSLLSALEVNASSAQTLADTGVPADERTSQFDVYTLTASDLLAQSDVLSAQVVPPGSLGQQAGDLHATKPYLIGDAAQTLPNVGTLMPNSLGEAWPGGLVAETLQMDRAGDLGAGTFTAPLGALGRSGLRSPKLPLTAASVTDQSSGSASVQTHTNKPFAIGQELPGIASPLMVVSGSDKGAVALPQGMVATKEAWLGEVPGNDNTGFVLDPAASGLAFGSHRSMERAAGAAADNGYNASGSSEAADSFGLSPSLPEVASGAGADTAQPGAEDRLAEQVTYWLSQKTQNAELTLDQGGQPVGVFVSLTGNEASISFSSDQALTREWLDASTSQLRDLLQAQGLSLADVTVGAHGQSSPQAGDQSQNQDRQGGRRAQVLVEEGHHKPAVVKPASGGQHRLDVFV
jgi:flagellar hook-length control protein FliK